VSQDDFSGPEAEQRYRNLQAHMVQPLTAEEHLMPAELQVAQSSELLSLGHQTDARPTKVIVHTSNNGSFRMRPRKQSHPERSPFF
jgi:hypothetical protein